jgi:hypothetical protein
VARGVTGNLYPMVPVDPRVVLQGDLDLEPRRPWLESSDLRRLVLRRLPDLIRDPDSSALEDEIHVAIPPWIAPDEGRAPTRLTWSLAPHSPAEGFAAEEAV